MDASAPRDPSTIRTRLVRSRRGEPWGRGILFFTIAAIVAVLADRWHAGIRQARAEQAVREQMQAHAEAIHGAIERRIRLLAGLRTFAQSRRSRAQLDEEFALFAEGTLIGVEGVRALQFVEGGRIVATWPLQGNEAALGYDLLSDPRPALGGDVRRALATGQLTVTGPVALVQGGTGLLIRQRIATRSGFPDLAAIVLDVPALVREAGIPSAGSGLRLEVLDRERRWFAGDPAGSAADPESLLITIEDGDWTLLGAPAAGWGALTAEPALAFRIAAGTTVLALGLLGFLIGTRERELAEAAAVAGSTRDLALRVGRMGTWAWDVRTNTVNWSEAAMRVLGFGAGDDPDPIARFFDRVHPEDRDAVRRVIASTAKGERDEYTIEYRIRHGEDSYRWVMALGQLERDANGAPLRLEGVLWDGTERRMLEDRVRQVDRLEALGQLASGVAHDFNNLLAAISGFAELARDRAGAFGDVPAAQEIRQDLDELLAVTDRGSAITKQLLAFSRRAPVKPRPMDLSEAVREVAPMLGRLLTSRVDLRTDLSDRLPKVMMDPGQFTQVLMNLLVNARDAMPDGGRVDVTTKALPAGDREVPPSLADTPCVLLEVADTGTGMSEAVRRRIFEPFFTTKEQGKGTGLGLPVVLAAIETAGGVLTVESEPGRGSVFRAYLPAAASRPSSPTVLT